MAQRNDNGSRIDDWKRLHAPNYGPNRVRDPNYGPNRVRELSNFTSPTRLVKLFDKVVTRSDIKLSRLAIPKYQARKHFPLHEANISDGTILCLRDNEGRNWSFRFTFWKSSQGYVFTSEWNHFVRLKGVNAGDVISFLRSTTNQGMQLYIDWKPQPAAKKEVITTMKRKENEGEEVQQVQAYFKLFGAKIST